MTITAQRSKLDQFMTEENSASTWKPTSREKDPSGRRKYFQRAMSLRDMRVASSGGSSRNNLDRQWGLDPYPTSQSQTPDPIVDSSAQGCEFDFLRLHTASGWQGEGWGDLYGIASDSPNAVQDLPSFLARFYLSQLPYASWVVEAGYERASGLTLDTADSVLEALGRFVEQQSLHWLEPSLSNTPEGEVSIEWNQLPKSVTVYVNAGNIEVLRAWGPDMDQDMEHLEVASKDHLLEAYRWLIER